MKDGLGGKITIKFVGLRTQTCNYLIDGTSEDKKAKSTKKTAIKRKIKFENYKNCLEVTQLENEISYLEKNKTDIDSIKKNQKEFIRSNELILKKQQKLKVNGIMFLLKKLIKLP